MYSNLSLYLNSWFRSFPPSGRPRLPVCSPRTFSSPFNLLPSPLFSPHLSSSSLPVCFLHRVSSMLYLYVLTLLFLGIYPRLALSCRLHLFRLVFSARCYNFVCFGLSAFHLPVDCFILISRFPFSSRSPFHHLSLILLNSLFHLSFIFFFPFCLLGFLFVS